MCRSLLHCVVGFCLTFLLLDAGISAAASPEEAARALLARRLPDRTDEIAFEVIGQENGRDVFEVESVDGKIVVRGCNAVTMDSGLNWYLKNVCHCHFSFNGDQLELPQQLPPLPQKVRHASPFQYRYCFNFCTFSYTMAWWDWPQWERMIDWMALHGINMPLSVTGQEAVWQKVYRDMGLSDEEIGRFFVGPGYLPFGWMGCMDGWAGPLPQSWIDGHRQLQQKIVARERELGMTPVLQGFTGHVPEALKKKFPEAKFQRLPSWCQFPRTYFIDPSDPLFRRIGKAFIEEQTRLYGTDHLYASDTFIEMKPPINDPAFLQAMSKSVYAAMEAGDPEAKWVMQGWIFSNARDFWKRPQRVALLGAVPDDRMIVLDLWCETQPMWNQTEAFHGKPWIWCVLHNFGETVGLYGGLEQMAKNLDKVCTSPDRGKLSGIGLTMEGFGYNPVVFDFVTDMTWRDKVPPMESWVREFTHRRYGRSVPRAEAAWELLRKTAYRVPGNGRAMICKRPRLGLRHGTPYDPKQFHQAWENLVACDEELGKFDTYRFDLVHLTREALDDLAGKLYLDITDAYSAGDAQALAKANRRFLELIADVDQLLGTREEFLLGRWLADAKRWATNEEERALYEWNARNIITLWGPRDNRLHEYSCRQWSGLMRGFYQKRWEMFLKRLETSLSEAKPFDAAKFEQDIRLWEEQWTRANESYPTVTSGDAVELGRRAWKKYGPAYTKAFGPNAVSLTTGRPTSCSSALTPHPAQLAADGRSRNTDMFWATDTGQDESPWWQVDLQKPTKVGRIVVVLYYKDTRHYGFTVETSLDGKTWTTVADRSDNKSPSTHAGHTCRFQSRQVRFIRVNVTHNSANTGRHLVEVMAFP